MYVHFRRSNPYPSLTVFDAPDGTLCTAARNRSNTPLQALTTLNDPVFVENAVALGRRVAADAELDDAGRIRRLFAACLAREPRPEEQAIITELVAAERANYRERPEQAAALVSVGSESAVSDGAVSTGDKSRLADIAAWAAAARSIMNLDEFVTRE
jgi:hypothetical protein